VDGTLVKSVRSVILLLMLTMLMSAIYVPIYDNTLKRLSKVYSCMIIRQRSLH